MSKPNHQILAQKFRAQQFRVFCTCNRSFTRKISFNRYNMLPYGYYFIDALITVNKMVQDVFGLYVKFFNDQRKSFLLLV